jgi:HSP20 family molecular chaperone IbpA
MTTSELQQAPERTMEPRDKQVLPREGVRPGLVFRPDVDIVERPEEYLVTADLPGVGEQDLTVQLADGVLSIDARPSVLPDESWQALHAEYRIGAYHREFAMSEAVDPDAISARMRDGVLEIRLPKTRRHQPRRIAIDRD